MNYWTDKQNIVSANSVSKYIQYISYHRKVNQVLRLPRDYIVHRKAIRTSAWGSLDPDEALCYFYVKSGAGTLSEDVISVPGVNIGTLMRLRGNAYSDDILSTLMYEALNPFFKKYIKISDKQASCKYSRIRFGKGKRQAIDIKLIPGYICWNYVQQLLEQNRHS